jgi:hypothetical protein
MKLFLLQKKSWNLKNPKTWIITSRSLIIARLSESNKTTAQI